MKDLFQCPDSVMAYLCVLYNVHKIPVGDDTARWHVEEVICTHPEVRQFYTASVQVRTFIKEGIDWGLRLNCGIKTSLKYSGIDCSSLFLCMIIFLWQIILVAKFSTIPFCQLCNLCIFSALNCFVFNYIICIFPSVLQYSIKKSKYDGAISTRNTPLK